MRRRLTVDLKLFKQLIKKKRGEVVNQISYRLQLMQSVSRAERQLSRLISKSHACRGHPPREQPLLFVFQSVFISCY